MRTSRAAAWSRDPRLWERVLRDVARGRDGAGFVAHRAFRSPITGGDGNIEFLVDLRTAGTDPLDELDRALERLIARDP